MNVCTICYHPRHAEIDGALRVPRAVGARVARRFGVNAQAVRRHERNGHVASAPAPEAAPVGDADDSPVMSLEELKQVIVGANGPTFAELLDAWYEAMGPWPDAIEAMYRTTYRMVPALSSTKEKMQ